MEDASLFVEPRKTSFSSKVLPYSTPESCLEGCFTAPSPHSTGLPSRQPFWSSRSTPYRVSGGSLLYQDRRLLWPNPQDTTGLSICGSGDTKVYPRVLGFTPNTHPLSDHSWMVLKSLSHQRGEEQTLRVTRESHPTLHSLQSSCLHSSVSSCLSSPRVHTERHTVVTKGPHTPAS